MPPFLPGIRLSCWGSNVQFFVQGMLTLIRMIPFLILTKKNMEPLTKPVNQVASSYRKLTDSRKHRRAGLFRFAASGISQKVYRFFLSGKEQGFLVLV
jgi:hypothetical protein